jgi:hypothetical protein
MDTFVKGALRGSGITFACAASMICSPASASPIYIVSPSALALIAASLPAGSQCLYITYDRNGNRLNRSSSVIAAAPATWGVSAFGCSRWSVSP